MHKRPAPPPIGPRLQQIRTLAGLSARELDRLADTTEGHTSLIESGVVKNVSTTTAAALAHVLGISLDWLVSAEGKEPSERSVRIAVEEARQAYGTPPKTGTS